MIRLSDFEKFASATLNSYTLGYYSSGTEDEVTLRENIAALKRYKIIPRLLRDVSRMDTSTTVLGHKITFPVCVGPTAQHRIGHDVGETGTAQGAAAAGTIFTLSSFASCTIEDVAKGSPDGCKFFNLYIFKNRDLVVDLVRRAEKFGYKALVVTIDSPLPGPGVGKRLAIVAEQAKRKPQRHRNLIPDNDKDALINEFPKLFSLYDASLTWKDIEWLKKITDLPLILKGILSVDDAKQAVKLGAAGILVSNHGGRQLDTTPATIDVLEEVVRTVNGRCEVYMDGGIRTGTDVLKALALGARAVFVGRPAIYALVYNGAKGVEEMLEILKAEFQAAMNMAGCSKVSNLSPDLLRHQNQLLSRI